MAPLFFKDMKDNFSCKSPAALAVCSSIDRRSMVRPTIVTRAIDRDSPHLKDPQRTKVLPLMPLPKPPSNPKKSRKSSEYRTSTSRSSVSTKDLISPANSSRYLLNDTAFFDIFPQLDQDLEPFDPSLVTSAKTAKIKGDEVSAVFTRQSSSKPHHDQVWTPSLLPISSPRLLHQNFKGEESSADSSPAILRPSSSTRTHHDHNQVVILRVSLHCKGCEGKVRKHISKMEGVTSFNIDFTAKKVTVTGNVTPLGVLNSVSKVKNAQFWSSPPRCLASF